MEEVWGEGVIKEEVWGEACMVAAAAGYGHQWRWGLM